MIALAQCQATCNICGVVKHQIDSTQERAMQVVAEAMDRHVAEAHAEHTELPTLSGKPGGGDGD